MRKIDLSGLKFNRLLVLGSDKRRKKSYFICKCDCGNLKSVRLDHLKFNKVVSCGCISKEGNQATHGHSRKGKISTEYRIWLDMIQRCTNPNRIAYKDYGGRGISVCDRWLNSFECFLQDVGYRPTPKHSLDRFPNNDGNYEPNNFRWATKAEQDRNKRSNHWHEYNGIKMIQADWDRYLGVYTGAVKDHMKRGKTIEQVVNYFKSKK